MKNITESQILRGLSNIVEGKNSSKLNEKMFDRKLLGIPPKGMSYASAVIDIKGEDPKIGYHETLDDAIGAGDGSAYHNSAFWWNERRNRWVKKYSATEPPSKYNYGGYGDMWSM